MAILNKTVVNSFSLLLKTVIVNKNGPLYLVFPPHQLQYVIWLSKGMIQIMTYDTTFNASFHKRRSRGGTKAERSSSPLQTLLTI